MSERRVALVHDYLNQRGGAERVFAHIASLYPNAPVYTALYDQRAAGDLIAPARVHVSGLQRIPGANRYFRYLAPLYPAAFEAFDLSGYDLVLSSTTAWAKGVIAAPGATHVCYIATVSRFVFNYDAYLGGFGAAAIAKPIVRKLAEWDRQAAARPTAYVANSRNVARRVEQYYGRRSYVLHPAVDVDRFTPGDGGGGYFLVVSRLLPYKRVDLAIEAARLAGVRLLVVGAGPALDSLKALAAGSNTEFAGPLEDAELARVLADARAVIVPGEEDFGIVPVEASAAGRPALAYGAGGALESILPGRTGEHFAEPTPQSLAALLRDFDPSRYDPQALRAHAEGFAPERFVARLREIVAAVEAGERP
jgi:glycosyltransferase involved in cell wall biosynthesis